MTDTKDETPDDTDKTPAIDYADLAYLGLSKLAIDCYAYLAEHQAEAAGKLAEQIKRPRTSVYHALEKLELWGFVEKRKSEIWPEVTHFRAIRLDKALENLAIFQRRAVRDLVDIQVEKSIYRENLIGLSVTRRDWR